MNIACELQSYFIKDDSNQSEVFIFINYMQIIKSFDAYILLVKKDFIDDAQSVLRTMYEKIFDMAYVIKEPSYINNLTKESYKQDLSLLKRMKEKNIFMFNKDYIDKQIFIDKEQLKKMENVKSPLDKASISDKVNLQEEYIHYKILCKYVHNDLGVAASNIIFKKDGIVLDVNNKEYNLNHEISKGIECMSYIIKIMSAYLKQPKFLKELDNIHEELFKVLSK